MILTRNQIEQAAKAICNSREFCGNEREAFDDWCADNGIKSNTSIYRQANFRAVSMWRGYQKEAGVPEKYIY